jgi:Flp pilus assembly protein TadB
MIYAVLVALGAVVVVALGQPWLGALAVILAIGGEIFDRRRRRRADRERAAFAARDFI